MILSLLFIILIFSLSDYARGRGWIPRVGAMGIMAAAILLLTLLKTSIYHASAFGLLTFFGLWMGYSLGWGKYQNARKYPRDEKEFLPADIVADWIYDKTSLDWLASGIGMGIRHMLFYPLFIGLAFLTHDLKPLFLGLGCVLSGFIYMACRVVPETIDPLKIAEPLRGGLIGLLIWLSI